MKAFIYLTHRKGVNEALVRLMLQSVLYCFVRDAFYEPSHVGKARRQNTRPRLQGHKSRTPATKSEQKELWGSHLDGARHPSPLKEGVRLPSGSEAQHLL